MSIAKTEKRKYFFFKADIRNSIPQKTIKYILIAFLISRIVLTTVGILSRNYYENTTGEKTVWNYTNKKILDVWGVWDTGYYLDIAKRGYSNNQNFQYFVSIPDNSYGPHQLNLGFPPLYSTSIKAFSLLTTELYTAGLLASNFFFLGSAFVLYKIAKILWSEEVAMGSVAYLFLYPTSFILSGVLSESLALFLALTAFYFAMSKNWIFAGIAIIFGVFNKLFGLFAGISFLFGFLKSKKNPSYWVGGLLAVFSIPLFLLFFYVAAGDSLAYFKIKFLGWNHQLTNPLDVLNLFFIKSQFFIPKNPIYNFVNIFFLANFSLILYSYKKIPLPLWLYWISMLIFITASGMSSAVSLPRYSLLFFPQYFALALLTHKRYYKIIIYIFLGVFQLTFMALWTNGIALI